MAATLVIGDTIALTIKQVTQITGVPSYTLRYWEKTFKDFLRPSRSKGKQRTYFAHDIEKINALKHMLWVEKITHAGVKEKIGIKTK